MNNRPRSVTVISWMFIAFGCIALLASLLPRFPEEGKRLAEFRSQHPVQYARFFVAPVLVLVCGGVFMLRGSNLARYLLVIGFGYNLFVNVLHSPLRLALPGLLFAVVVNFLFRPPASAFFRGSNVDRPQIPKTEV